MGMSRAITHFRRTGTSRMCSTRVMTVAASHMQDRLHAVHDTPGTGDRPTAAGAVLVRTRLARVILFLLGVGAFARSEHIENGRPPIRTSNTYVGKKALV